MPLKSTSDPLKKEPLKKSLLVKFINNIKLLSKVSNTSPIITKIAVSFGRLVRYIATKKIDIDDPDDFITVLTKLSNSDTMNQFLVSKTQHHEISTKLKTMLQPATFKELLKYVSLVADMKINPSDKNCPKFTNAHLRYLTVLFFYTMIIVELLSGVFDKTDSSALAEMKIIIDAVNDCINVKKFNSADDERTDNKLLHDSASLNAIALYLITVEKALIPEDKRK